MNYKDIKLGHYYMATPKFLFEKEITPIGKCIGKDEYYILMEYIQYMHGHSGSHTTLVEGKSGKDGYCWFVKPSSIIKEITLDELMVYEL
jgi:hypothetical protein